MEVLITWCYWNHEGLCREISGGLTAENIQPLKIVAVSD